MELYCNNQYYWGISKGSLNKHTFDSPTLMFIILNSQDIYPNTYKGGLKVIQFPQQFILGKIVNKTCWQNFMKIPHV